MRHGFRWLTVWALIATVGGCSLAMSGPDPERPSNQIPKCDTGKGLVGLDGVIGGGFAIGTLGALSAGAPEAAAVSALVATAFIASAARGNGIANRCRDALADYAPMPELDNERPNERTRITEDPYAPQLPSQRPTQRPIEWAPGRGGPPAPVTPPPQPTVQNPDPAQPPAARPKGRPAAKQPPVADVAEDDWTDFWTEIP